VLLRLDLDRDYGVLHRYVRLSSERDLGPLADWSNFVVMDSAARLAVGSAEVHGDAPEGV